MKNEFEFSSYLWQIKTTNHRLEKHRFGKMVVPKFFVFFWQVELRSIALR